MEREDSKVVRLNDYLRLDIDILRKELGETVRLNRDQMIHRIMIKFLEEGITVNVKGTLEVVAEHFGFLRFCELDFKNSVNDVYVPLSRRNNAIRFKEGDEIECSIQSPDKSKYFQIEEICLINGLKYDKVNKLKDFKDYTATFPNQWARLSDNGNNDHISRIIDLIAPIGFGQRGVIGASPKCGKTTILESLAKNFHRLECQVIILMIAERPEETTYLRSRLPEDIKIITSNFDEDPQRHVKLVQLVKEYCKRKVENGAHIVLLIDSLTRFVRAANLMLGTTPSKTLTGGLDAQVLLKIKSVLGIARKLLNGGSLTIVGTALIETGSKMDDIIFDECKSTTNWDLILTKDFTEKGLFPAVDIFQSSTRRSDLFLEERELRSREVLRRVLSSLGAEEALRRLIELVKTTESNEVIFSRFLSLGKEDDEMLR